MLTIYGFGVLFSAFTTMLLLAGVTTATTTTAVATPACCRPPAVYWRTVPVYRNETMVVAGAGFGNASIAWCPGDGGCTPATDSSVWETSVHAVLPSSCGPPCALEIQGLYGVTSVQVNAPQVSWARILPSLPPSADLRSQSAATSAAVLRVFGRGLGWMPDATTCVSAATPRNLTSNDGISGAGFTTLSLDGAMTTARSQTCYEAEFVLPLSEVRGAKAIAVLATVWGNTTFTVSMPSSPPLPLAPVVINVERDHGGDIRLALAAAAAVDAPRRVVVHLGARKVYALAAPLIIPNRTALVGAGVGTSVLEATLPDALPPLPRGKRIAGHNYAHTRAFAVGGGGSDWSLQNVTVTLVRSPPLSAAVWLDGCGRQGMGAGKGMRLLGIEVRLLQDNVSNNAVVVEGCTAPNGTGGGSNFEIGWSTFVQEGSCWLQKAENGQQANHTWGGNSKSVITTISASGGWLHHNQVSWNCGGWGSFVTTDRTILEHNIFNCTSATPAGNGTAIIEGGSDINSWDFRSSAHPSAKLWTVVRNRFYRPPHNDEVDPTHQNMFQRETFTTDAPGEYGHGMVVSAHGTRIKIAWNRTNEAPSMWNTPAAGATILVLAGPGLGQRRSVVGFDNKTGEVLVHKSFDAFVTPSLSYVAVISSNHDIIIAGNSFAWGEVLQFFGDTLEGVIADNTLENCNVKGMNASPNETWTLGALRVHGSCYHGASPAFFTEVLGNSLVNSDGISMESIASGMGAGCVGFRDHNVSFLQWVVVRRNNVSGISDAARILSAEGPHPTCGFVEKNGAGNAVDVVAEHNHFSCPAPGVLPSNGYSFSSCVHCIMR
jgi:hypothetical protein